MPSLHLYLHLTISSPNSYQGGEEESHSKDFVCLLALGGAEGALFTYTVMREMAGEREHSFSLMHSSKRSRMPTYLPTYLPTDPPASLPIFTYLPIFLPIYTCLPLCIKTGKQIGKQTSRKANIQTYRKDVKNRNNIKKTDIQT